MRGDKMPVNLEPKHLLLIGPTKFGKTDYAVQAMNAGYELMYVNRDNAMGTIRKVATPEAMSRLHYFEPEIMIDFVEKFQQVNVFRWNITQNKEFQSGMAASTDEVCEIYPSRMDRRVIFVIDTWTSLAWSAMEVKALDLKVDLADIDKWGREIYGNSGFRLTRIAKILQVSKFQQIIMAHPTIYEIKQKPPGIVGDVKEKDMIITGTVEIPTSSSNPHGYSIGSYFGEIGWLIIDNAGQRRIDFTLKKGRLGAGTPNKILDPRLDGSWVKLFGAPPERDLEAKPWIDYFIAEEFAARQSLAAANAPRLGSTMKAKVTT